MDDNPHYNGVYEQIIKRQWISLDGITEDDIDSFVLNVRLLMQDNDGYSIQCLANEVYSQCDVPKELKDEFNKNRHNWHDYIESSSIFEHFNKVRNFTNKELFDIILYGGLAHSNRDKVALFYIITNAGLFSSVVCAWFLNALHIFMGIIRNIREVNNKVLKYYSDNKKETQ
jgi:hypothetical protein